MNGVSVQVIGFVPQAARRRSISRRDVKIHLSGDVFSFHSNLYYVHVLIAPKPFEKAEDEELQRADWYTFLAGFRQRVPNFESLSSPPVFGRKNQWGL